MSTKIVVTWPRVGIRFLVVFSGNYNVFCSSSEVLLLVVHARTQIMIRFPIWASERLPQRRFSWLPLILRSWLSRFANRPVLRLRPWGSNLRASSIVAEFLLSTITANKLACILCVGRVCQLLRNPPQLLFLLILNTDLLLTTNIRALSRNALLLRR